MPVQKICTVAEAVRLNEYAYALTLEVGEEMAARTSCGQFVHIKCGEERLLRRPISICSWDKTTLRVVFEVRGEGTEWLSRRKAGDELDVLGPLGHGFDPTVKKILVVGGGIGVPPMLGVARAAAAAGAEVHAALGFRDQGHKMLTDEFAECCRSMSVISDDGSTGRKGFVTELVEEFLRDTPCVSADCASCSGRPVPPVVMACGPKGMLKAVAKACAAHGVECQVSLEERMGCGVGADGSRKHVCKDGPVFNAKEVDWND